MKAAEKSKRYFEKTNLLLMNKENQIYHKKVADLLDYFKEGDVLVVNHSATVPSSFKAKLRRTEEVFELRLAAFQGENSENLRRWAAFSFKSGHWSQKTEDRVEAPEVKVGDMIDISKNLSAKVIDVKEKRMLVIDFEGSNLALEMFDAGQPIQYSYLKEELGVWDQQTIFSSQSISVEPPSASFVFNWELLLKLKKKGVIIKPLLHSAGISSTGDEKLDSLLPLNEFYEIPQETVDEVLKARKEGRKVIALGTTVLRALESYAESGKLQGHAKLKITPDYQIQLADALFSGMHEPGTSHMKILKSLCPLKTVYRAYQEASYLGYRGHEYGDVSLLDCGCK